MTPDKKIKVAVLGATGTVGQRMVSLLDGHPWFEVSALCASEKSAGKPYAEAVGWQLDGFVPERFAKMVVKPCVTDGLDAAIALSGLDADVAGDIETAFAKAGIAVVSNARNHRMEPDVPLVIPEVNADHLAAIEVQRKNRGWKGCIVTNPNCSTIGLAVALKPLHDAFGVKKVMVTTMQAISGAGYPGVPSLDILDNVVPFIKGEEEKMQSETLKLLGGYDGAFSDAAIAVSAHCNRVLVRDGHTESVSVEMEKKPALTEVADVLRNWKPETSGLGLPTLPARSIVVHEDPARPQPRRDRDLGRGMTVSVGRLRPCPILDWKFTVLSHNTVRGAAGAALADAELLVAKGFVK